MRFVLTIGLLAFGGTAFAQSIETSLGGWTAQFDKPVARYGHGIMGNVPEWSRLCMTRHGKSACVTLESDSIFEDMAPRLADIDKDGEPEAIVVETQEDLGAALVVYDLIDGKLNKTATPNIGTRFRWLAPIGVADFNGDGDLDVAYVDRPHLAKTLIVWTYRDAELTKTAELVGVTNHKIGDPFIASTIRACDGKPEMILTDASRTYIVSAYFDGISLTHKAIGRFSGPESITQAAKCN